MSMSAGNGHFNGLTPAEDERLTALYEESAEVIQAVAKIQRHGYESNNRGRLPETNRQALERECGDLLFAVRRMVNREDISLRNFYILDREAKCKPYFHHQPDEATQNEEAAFDINLTEILAASRAVTVEFLKVGAGRCHTIPQGLIARLEDLLRFSPERWRGGIP